MSEENNITQTKSETSSTPASAYKKKDSSRREWIVFGLFASPFICLLIAGLAFFLTIVALQGAGPSTDPKAFNAFVKLPGVIAIISIVLLLVCTAVGWIAYRKEHVNLASVMSLLVVLMPVFFCVLGCVALFVIP